MSIDGIILATFTSLLANAQRSTPPTMQYLPHNRTVPSLNNAAEIPSEVLISTTRPAISGGGIASGTRAVAVADESQPQPTTVPLLNNARECDGLAAT